MKRRIFGLENEYGLTCTLHGQRRLSPDNVARYLFEKVTILYEDLVNRGLQAFDVNGPQKARRIARRLRDTGPCLMCEMDLRTRGAATARDEVLRDGHDPRALEQLATRTRTYWWPTVCGRCAHSPSSVRCRIHFREEVRHGQAADPEAQRTLLEHVMGHLLVYAQSFVWGHQGTEGDADRAALISAVGWCSGWRGLFAVGTMAPA